MSEPDIIDPLPNGLQAWNWIESVEITRQGSKAIPGGDKWRVALPLRASLADANGDLMLDSFGKEIPVTPTRTFAPIDLADYLHHPRIAALVQEIRDVTLGLVKGDYQPLPPEE